MDVQADVDQPTGALEIELRPARMPRRRIHLAAEDSRRLGVRPADAAAVAWALRRTSACVGPGKREGVT